MTNMTEITVPLNRLKVSEYNVRQVPADAMSDAELKASLASVGLLQNHIVHEDENDEGYYCVDLGGRRAMLLKELASEGGVSEDTPIHCLLAEDVSRITELSLMENEMRADMHPADQVEAYARLVRQGMAASEIAVRFGIAGRTVEQRLRLGNVSPVILDAYRDGDTNMQTLEAFALTTDQKLQEEIWNNFHETRGFVREYMVREILLNKHMPGNTRIAEFVGLEDYEKAGGRVTRDLFAEEDLRGVWLENPEIVYDLADRKMTVIADGLKEDWKWVEFMLEFGYAEESQFNKVFPVDGEFTEEENAEVEALVERKKEIQKEGVSDATRKEFNAIGARLSKLGKLRASRDYFTEEQREIAGCVVSIDYSGKAKIIKGLVKAADMPKAGSKAADDVKWKDPEKKVKA